MDEVDPNTGGDAIVYHSFLNMSDICSSKKTKRNKSVLIDAEPGVPALRGVL
jgi:hypothetical protein